MIYAFTWQYGRRLSSISHNGDSISYTYDPDGIRTSKTVNGTTTKFHIMNGTLLGQTRGSDKIVFLYDEKANRYGFDYNGTKYYYIFNVQGDVIGILNQAGQKIVSYTYDPWGKVPSVDGSEASTIGQINPIRYRGYYYDTETGFYYLQSRYYDPITRRFLNADDRINGTTGLIGFNIFSYCNNNPIINSDPSGHSIIAAILIACLVVTLAIIPSSSAQPDIYYSNRKPGRTPPSKWPPLPENLGGKKPSWNPEGYWDGKYGGRYTWDNRSHGAGVDRGDGAQDGHWDDETSNNRWDRNGQPLESITPYTSPSFSVPEIDANVINTVVVVGTVVIGVVYLFYTGDPSILQRSFS